MNKKKPVFSLSELHKPDSWVLSCANIPNSDLICTGSYDGTMQMIKLNKEKRELEIVKTVDGLDGCLNDIKFSNKRNLIAVSHSKEEKMGRWHV
jgi:WD40 repeat protein